MTELTSISRKPVPDSCRYLCKVIQDSGFVSIDTLRGILRGHSGEYNIRLLNRDLQVLATLGLVIKSRVVTPALPGSPEKETVLYSCSQAMRSASIRPRFNPVDAKLATEVTLASSWSDLSFDYSGLY